MNSLLREARLQVRALPAYVRALCEDAKIEVRFDRTAPTAFTDGKAIVFPHLPIPADPEQEQLCADIVTLVKGFAMHEGAGHVRHTDFGVLSPDIDRLTHRLWNIAEDIRIEQQAMEDYAGASVTLTKIAHLLIASPDHDPDVEGKTPIDVLLRYVLCAARGFGLKQPGPVRGAAVLRPLICDMLGSTALDAIDAYVEQMADLNSTQEAMDLAERFREDLRDWLDEDPQQGAGDDSDESSTSDDGETDDSSDANSAEADSPQPSPGDPGEGEPADPDQGSSDSDRSTPTGDAEPGDESSDDGSQDGEGTDTQTDTGSGNGSSDVGNADDGSSDAPSADDQSGDSSADATGNPTHPPEKGMRNALRRSIDKDTPSATDLGDLISDALEEELNELPDSVSRAGVETDTHYERRSCGEPLDLTEVNAASLRATSRLKQALQARKRVNRFYSDKGQRISPQRLARYRLKNASIFEKKRVHRAMHTAVMVTLDGSMSMRDFGRIEIARNACGALAIAADRVKAECAVSIFPGNEVLKPFGGRLDPEKWRLAYPLGGTPMGEAMMFGNQLLLQRRADRRIHIAICDGQPDVDEPVHEAINLGKAVGIEFFGIGIEVSVQHLFEQHVSINDVNDLPELLLELFSNRMLAAA